VLLEQLSPNNPTPSSTFATLASGINNSVTSLSVSSASFFPTVGQFRILIDSEYMIVTAVSGTTLTVTRGAEGSAAASHSSGARISGVLTQGSLAQVISDAVPFTVVHSSGYGKTGVALQAGAITASSTTLTVSGINGTSTFTAADVGKAIQVVGAGASGADLYTTIASFTSSTVVDLTAAASTTVTKRTVVWYPSGQDDTTAIQAAINGMTNDSGILCLPPGVYVISSTLTASQHLMAVVGGGMNQTYVVPSSAGFTGDMLDMSQARGYRILDIAFKHAGLSAATAVSVVTAWSITTNVATLTGTNSFSAGQAVCLSGFTGTGNIFNDQFVTITASAGSTFSFAFTHTDASGTDNGAAYLDYNCIGFPINSTTLLYADLQNVQTMNAPGVGVKFALSVVCRFEGCVFLSNRAHGVALYNSQNIGSTSTEWTNCYSNGNGLAGYYLHIVNYSSLRTCAADSNGISYYLFSCKGVTLEGCGSEATVDNNAAFPGYDVYFHGGQANVVDGCYFSKNSGVANAGGTYVVFDNTASFSRVSNCVFAGQLAQLPTNVFTVASACVGNTIWEPYLNNNASSAYTDAGTGTTLYESGAFVVGGAAAPYTTSNPLYLGGSSSVAASAGIVRSIKGTTTTFWYAGDGGATANIALIGITSGGSLVLGDGTNGANVNLNVPSGNLVQLQSAGTNALAITLRAAGTTQIQFGAGVTAANINWATAASGAGGTFVIQGQGGAAGANGGLLALAGGAGGAGGTDAGIELRTGSTARITVSTTAITAALPIVSAADLQLGDGSTGTDVVANAKTGQLFRVKINSTDVFTISGTKITAIQPIAMSSGTVATSGGIRFAGGAQTFLGGVASGGATIGLLGLTAGDSLTIGDGVNNANINPNIPRAGLIQWQTAGTNAWAWTLRDNGANTLVWGNAVTSWSISSSTLSSGTGATGSIHAQPTSSGAGGSLTVGGGVGTTRYGDLVVDTPLAIGKTSIAMADAPQTLSVANSAAGVVVVTGTNTAVRALTISCAPTSGALKLIDNQCIGGGITVQFLTGTATATIPIGCRAIVYGDGTNANAIILGLGASSGWTAIYDADWTTLGTSVAAGNGNFSIDGRNWTVANFANSATFQLTNGTGLIIKCNANNTDWTSPTDTLPKVSISLSTLLPGITLDPSWGVRIFAQIAVTATTNFEGAVFSYGIASGFNQNFYFIKGVRSAVNTIQYGSNAAGSNVTNINDTTNFSDDALIMEMDGLFDERARASSGVYSAGWPAVGSQRLRAIMRQSTAVVYQPSMVVTTDPAIMFGAKSTDTAAVAQLVVKRLRVEIHI
jgi:hypothetical protein